VITDNLNPAFVKSIVVNYFFETKQEMRVTVFDIDDFNPTAKVEQNLMGSADFRLDQVLSSKGGVLTLPLREYLLSSLV
jgi:hypothetical protein